MPGAPLPDAANWRAPDSGGPDSLWCIVERKRNAKGSQNEQTRALAEDPKQGRFVAYDFDAPESGMARLRTSVQSTRRNVALWVNGESVPYSGPTQTIEVRKGRNRLVLRADMVVGGRYVRLERPMPVYSRGAKEAFDIWLSESPDLRFWGASRLVMGAERVPFATGKIGPAAPPVKTPRGWLATFHAVRYVDADLPAWHAAWRKEYLAGLMLLDLDDPSNVVGLCREPLLVPEATCEKDGFRGSVIFPGGMILEDNGEVKIYYGAADTVECLATAHVDDLLALCEPLVIA